MWNVAVEFLDILNQSALYLLAGFFLAGVLHSSTARSPWLVRLLAGRGPRPVFLAALLGIPLPLCSCSVVPAAMAMRRKGASNGTTASFLISEPETDIVSIVLSTSLLGPTMSVFRVFAALTAAVTTGLTINLMERLFVRGPTANDAAEGDDDHAHDEYDPNRGFWNNALRFGFVGFFDDLIGSLLFGLLLGAIITAFLPELGVDKYAAGSWMSYAVMAAIGVPMYVCASASTPIAAGLIAAGVTPGAALVFLLTGPATNAASIYVLARRFSRPAFVTYLCGVLVISLAMGVWFDRYIGASGVKVAPGFSLAESGGGWLEIAATIVFSLMCVASLRRTRAIGKSLGVWTARLGMPMSAPAAKATVLSAMVGAYAASGFSSVGAGERGMELRFGRVERSNLSPGLYYALPWPFGRIDAVSVSQLRRLEIGFRTEPANAPGTDSLLQESWALTGNQDIIAIKWVLHYRIRDDADAVRMFLYGTEDVERAIRSTAEHALRVDIAQRDIDTLYTVERQAIEDDVATRVLQPALDQAGIGVRVERVQLVEVHSPAEVHAAFRDVASASEDAERERHEATEYLERIVSSARGEANETVEKARASAAEIVHRARGEGARFEMRRAAMTGGERVTRTRLFLENVDRLLPGFKKLIDLTSETEAPGFDLWYVPEPTGVPVFTPPGDREP